MDNEDKDAWVRAGEEQEERFAGPVLGSGAAVFANPAKKENRYTHDIFVVLPGDLKTVRTLWRTAHRYGIDPQYAITLNKKDVERYQKFHPDIIIVWDIDIPGFRSRRYSPLKDILKAVSSGHAKLHHYKNRVNDTRGNAKETYVLDARWFREL